MGTKITATDLTYGYCDSPLGPILVAGDAHVIHMISFKTGHKPDGYIEDWTRDDSYFPKTFAQLKAYFRGDLVDFDLPLLFGGTIFQNKVWKALCDIPYGQTISYGELARRIDNPKAQQAVGQANGANPIPIVIPCHRVLNSDESLGGFTGGVEIKKFLLKLEGSGPKQMELI